MWLFVCRSGPAEELAVRELVDMLMMALVFGREARLLLLGDGILNLSAGDRSPLIDLDGLLSSPCLVSAPVPDSNGILPAETASPEQLRKLFHDSEQVVMF